MEEVDEGYEISIKETDEYKVKDIDIGLNTSQSGIASFITELINGYLEVVCISTDKPIQIKIGIYEKDIIIFEDVNFSGMKYLPLRLNAISKENELYNYSQEKWALNDRLFVEVKGQTNTLVNIKFRYC